MASNSKKTIKKLVSDIDHDFNSMVDELYQNLRRLTQIDTGQARAGWRKLNAKSKFESGPIINNRVDHITALDEGHSRQAAKGIVEPAINKTRRLK